MKIFVDSANVGEIKKWIDYGIADGVTTNPTIMLKDGAKNVEERAREIISAIGSHPLSIEVTSVIPSLMIEEAEYFHSWSRSIIVKIPVISQEGRPYFDVMKVLRQRNIRVNATCCFTLGQAILSVKAGAYYASIFAGRVADEGGDPWQIVSHSVEWIKKYSYNAYILTGSIRSTMDIQNAVIAGTDIVTIPPALLDKWADHKYSRFTVKQFMEDAK